VLQLSEEESKNDTNPSDDTVEQASKSKEVHHLSMNALNGGLKHISILYQ